MIHKIKESEDLEKKAKERKEKFKNANEMLKV
jgi:hypothetical protein